VTGGSACEGLSTIVDSVQYLRLHTYANRVTLSRGYIQTSAYSTIQPKHCGLAIKKSGLVSLHKTPARTSRNSLIFGRGGFSQRPSTLNLRSTTVPPRFSIATASLNFTVPSYTSSSLTPKSSLGIQGHSGGPRSPYRTGGCCKREH